MIEQLLLNDVHATITAMTHLTAHLPLLIVPVILGGFVWAKTRK